ncbi:unnamed protein product, partial [Ixodes pacificus]
RRTLLATGGGRTTRRRIPPETKTRKNRRRRQAVAAAPGDLLNFRALHHNHVFLHVDIFSEVVSFSLPGAIAIAEPRRGRAAHDSARCISRRHWLHILGSRREDDARGFLVADGTGCTFFVADHR